MGEYIGREVLLKAIEKLDRLDKETNTQYEYDKEGYILLIQNAPAANVVEANHGEWVAYELAEDDDGYGYGDSHEKRVIWYKCSVCGVDALGRCYEDEWYSYPIRTDYCPKCGAKMDGRRDT